MGVGNTILRAYIAYYDKKPMATSYWPFVFKVRIVFVGL
jgi:hypothetical protein